MSVETAEANAGSIDLKVGQLLHLRDSRITTSVAGGKGDGGNIRIDPVFVVLDKGSRIIANAREGHGGNIFIRITGGGALFRSPDSLIRASSEFGVDGSVEIDSPDTDLTGGITALPESLFDATALLGERCGVQAVRGQSSLVIRGGSIPPEPDRYLSASYREGPGSASVPPGSPEEARGTPGSETPFTPEFAWFPPDYPRSSLRRGDRGLELGCGD